MPVMLSSTRNRAYARRTDPLACPSPRTVAQASAESEARVAATRAAAVSADCSVEVQRFQNQLVRAPPPIPPVPTHCTTLGVESRSPHTKHCALFFLLASIQAEHLASAQKCLASDAELKLSRMRWEARRLLSRVLARIRRVTCAHTSLFTSLSLYIRVLPARFQSAAPTSPDTRRSSSVRRPTRQRSSASLRRRPRARRSTPSRPQRSPAGGLSRLCSQSGTCRRGRGRRRQRKSS